MKKLIAVATIILMLAMMATGASAANVQFKAAKGTAAVDCVKDDAYQAADAIPVKFGATADSSSGTVWALWDGTALYFYAEISDKTPSSAAHADNTVWQRDSVEFYIDLTDAKTDTDITTINAGQYTCGLPYPNGEVWGGMGGHWSNYHEQCSYKTKLVDGGWVCEAKIVFGSEFKPASNAEIGFTVAINDDADDADGREYQMFISDGQSNAWSTTGDFYDRLILSDNVYTPPVTETEAPAVNAPAETAPAAAQTADFTGIAVFAAAVALIGAAVVSKKKH